MNDRIMTVAEMVAVEQAADAGGWSYAAMMETAGKRVAEAIAARLPPAGKTVTVLVGPGNNGGDGLVAGRYLAEMGADVGFYLYRPRDPQADENMARVQEMGLLALVAEYDQRYRVLRHRLTITDILVDALLGTGASRPIGGDLAQLLRQVSGGLAERRAIMAAAQQPPLLAIETATPRPAGPLLVAVDCPSGLNCDTGDLDPLALPADLTVTFAGAKRGHFRFPGAGACGTLVVADIGIPADLPALRDVVLRLATAARVRDLLPPRPPDGHKGRFGRVLIAAGSSRYQGAPLLAARGAFRAGAGLVTLAVPDAVRAAIVAALPEATYMQPLPPDLLNAGAGARVRDMAPEMAALLVGPGLDAATGFIKALFNGSPLPPLLVDADGLNLLAAQPDWWSRLPPRTVLTPHPGEMARLLGSDLAAVLAADRVALAREAAARWGHIVLLKGAFTVVADPGGATTLLPFANPLLAVGGSGDVLSGVIAALLAQGADPYAAAVAGGYLHALAAQRLRGRLGAAGLLTSELADEIPAARLALG